MNKKKFRKVEPHIWMAPYMILMGFYYHSYFCYVENVIKQGYKGWNCKRIYWILITFFESNPYISVSNGVKNTVVWTVGSRDCPLCWDSFLLLY